jgi:hypothetical protein
MAPDPDVIFGGIDGTTDEPATPPLTFAQLNRRLNRGRKRSSTTSAASRSVAPARRSSVTSSKMNPRDREP